jgi:hypothetical protein
MKLGLLFSVVRRLQNSGVIAATLALAACSPPVPNTSIGGAYVQRGVSSARIPSGVYAADVWSKGWPPDAVEAPNCATEKADFERLTGLEELAACGDVRARSAPAVGDGDTPVAIPTAPHCYALGKVMLVVEFEEVKTGCTRIVGLGVVPTK